MTVPILSVIIPTYNSEDSIGGCLESIENQLPFPFEVIVVDNFSQDQTQAISKRYNVDFVQDRSNVSEARNIGLERSTGKYVLFLDADQVLNEGLFKEVSELMEGKELDCLVIPEDSGAGSFWDRCLGFEKRLKSLNDREYPRVFSREILDEVGGYDPVLRFGEDMDLFFRMVEAGASIGSTRTRLIHKEFKGLRHQLRKYVYYGKHSRQILTKYPSSQVFSQFNLHSTGKTIKHYMEDPIHGAGFVCLRILRSLSALYGAFITEIKR